LDLARIERILSNEIGIKVGLLTKKSINPILQNYINKEIQFIYQ